MSDSTSAKPKKTDNNHVVYQTNASASSQKGVSSAQENSCENEHAKKHTVKKVIESPDVRATETVPTIGQLTRTTAQAIQKLYKGKLGHSPSRVTCQLMADKLIVWAEGSLTKAEKLLSHSMRVSEAKLLRESLDNILRQDLIDLVEQQLKVKVITLLTDTCQQNDCTAMVILLAEQPTIRVSKHTVQYF